MRIDSALNFMLFAYFGITLGDESKTIIDGIISRAYRDASGHVLSVKEDNKSYKNDAKEYIECFLDSIKNNDFNELHKNCAKELVTLYKDSTNEGYEFTYGVAQKWLNMSVKYLIIAFKIIESHNESNEFVQEYKSYISNIEKSCDVPIDDYMLQAVSQTERTQNRIETGLDLRIAPNDKYKSKGKVTYGSGNYLKWSNYNFNDEDWLEEKDYYHELQTEIKNNITVNSEQSVLDWENETWIQVAKKRKGVK